MEILLRAELWSTFWWDHFKTISAGNRKRNITNYVTSLHLCGSAYPTSYYEPPTSVLHDVFLLAVNCPALDCRLLHKLNLLPRLCWSTTTRCLPSGTSTLSKTSPSLSASPTSMKKLPKISRWTLSTDSTKSCKKPLNICDTASAPSCLLPTSPTHYECSMSSRCTGTSRHALYGSVKLQLALRSRYTM
jgi:hypothetical protein